MEKWELYYYLSIFFIGKAQGDPKEDWEGQDFPYHLSLGKMPEGLMSRTSALQPVSAGCSQSPATGMGKTAGTLQVPFQGWSTKTCDGQR